MTGPKFVIHASPSALKRRYGKSINDGDLESLGTYIFTSSGGAVVNVYFRANDMWSLLLRLARPLFWRSNTPVELTIGAASEEEGLAFAEWLATELNAAFRKWP